MPVTFVCYKWLGSCQITKLPPVYNLHGPNTRRGNIKLRQSGATPQLDLVALAILTLMHSLWRECRQHGVTRTSGEGLGSSSLVQIRQVIAGPCSIGTRFCLGRWVGQYALRRRRTRPFVQKYTNLCYNRRLVQWALSFPKRPLPCLQTSNANRALCKLQSIVGTWIPPQLDHLLGYWLTRLAHGSFNCPSAHWHNSKVKLLMLQGGKN